jgi:8-oxo-dGTP pyrophosphatase MutT (NUDIX family)
MPHAPKPVDLWTIVEARSVYGCRIFSLTERRSRSPRTGDIHDFHVLECPDWVNIVPLTADREVVMVKQYRHGLDGITLEIPGGMLDPDDPSPLVAARREMQEETGYDSADVVPIGVVHPNPAIQTNRCHTFLARDVRLTGPLRWDGTEETEVVVVPLDRVPELVRDGAITHALVVAAFHWLALYRGPY